MKNLSKLFKVLANEKRLLILKYLIRADLSTLEKISQKINLSYKSTSKHLLILEREGYLERKTQGARVFYSIPHFKTDDPHIQLLRMIKET